MRFLKKNFLFLLFLIIAVWSYFAGFKNTVLLRFNWFFNSGLEQENLNLRLENENLKSRLNLPDKEKTRWFAGLEYRPAAVFSTYPFNNQRLLSVVLGSEDGVQEGMPVAAGEGILLGQVIKVFPKYSLVRTVFDPDFKTPVRVGASAADALLEGGNQPMITLINKNSAVSSGNSVYSAGAQFPYWMQVGTLGLVPETQDKFFKKAELKPPYNLNELKTVFIIVNF